MPVLHPRAQLRAADFAKQSREKAPSTEPGKAADPLMTEYATETSLRSDLFCLFLVKNSHKTTFLLVTKTFKT